MEHERLEEEKSVISRVSKAPSSIHNHTPRMYNPDTIQLRGKDIIIDMSRK